MLPAGNSAAGPSLGRLLNLLFLLFLAGVAMRMTILAMPPVIPLVHDELHMSETQVGLLVGLPLALFAVAAVPGSLLIARIGTNLAVIVGMVIAALASGARGAADRRIDALCGRDRDRLRRRHHAAGNADAGPRMAAGPHRARHHRLYGRHADRLDDFVGLDHSLSCLPLVGGSWRHDLVFWAVPAFLIAPVFYLLSPTSHEHRAGRTARSAAAGGRIGKIR